MALGGVGEAMLLGAAIGGGSKALLDPNADIDDILKSAALGTATGYLGGGGIGNLLSGTPTAGILSNTAASAAGAGGTSGIAGLEAAVNPSQVAANLGVPGIEVSTLPGSQSAMLADQMSGFGPEGLENLRAATEGASAVPQSMGSPDAFRVGPVEETSLFKDPLGYLKDNRMLAGASAAAGLLGNPATYEPPEKKKYRNPYTWQNPLNRFTFADGGIASVAPPGYDMVVGEMPMYARGGVSDLGSYSDGGRMLKGAGDGMSDSIPGVIAGKRPARLADGEFVVPADVVSHLGNGSTDAGAKQLYAMMDKVRRARTGNKKQGRQINPRRFMPA